MGRLSASTIVISAILIMAALNLVIFGATYTTPSSSSLYLTPPYDNTTRSFDSAACNCTLINDLNASDEEVVSRLYPIISTCIVHTRTVIVSPAITKRITVTQDNTINSGTVACTTIPSTATVTQSITILSESGAVACSTKQANTAAGVVGGFVGGSVFGIMLAVLITAMAAVLITKRHHKKGEISTQSRTLRYFSPSADGQDTESEQTSYQNPLTLRIADDNSDSDTQPDYDYVNSDQQPVIELTQCPAYRSTAQQ